MEKIEFLRRREQLMQQVGKGSIVIIPTAPERQRNRDIHFFYRADSDFYYLTGFAEPEAVAVLIPEREQGEYILFCREKDPEKETWHGRRAGLEGACQTYDADDAFPISDIDEILPGLMENCRRLYYPMGCYADFDAKVVEWMNHLRGRSRIGINLPNEISPLEHTVHEMRLVKSEAEIAAMRRAAEISVLAHQRAMQTCRAGMLEYQLEAEILHEFVRHGSRAPAYPSIVGGGSNACILHYIENTGILKENDLVLIDAGCEYDYYASDITRTFPVNGKFSKEQKAIYQLVLKAQLAAIAKIHPGARWNELYDVTVQIMTEGLMQLGILKGKSVDRLIAEGDFKKFYMHKAGHWLGMDVHDVGNYKIDEQWRELKPGMVTTVEPGIYIPAGSTGVEERWWNIGVRIEDDVLVTKTGHEVLTAGAQKTVEEIEALMATR